jgi:hypothetical protein
MEEKMYEHTYIGNYPENSKRMWTEEINGVTHDNDNWYFTAIKEFLFKIPVEFNLANYPAYNQIVTHTGIPQELGDKGYNHFGDLDYYNGYLFIPVEDSNGNREPRIAVFRASDLTCVGSTALWNQTGAGWCAINPMDGLLYASNSDITPYSPVHRYQIIESQLGLGHVPEGSNGFLIKRQLFFLYDDAGSQITLRVMQGGVFSDEGYLYLNNGYAKYFNPHEGGIHVFDGDGCLESKSSIDDMPFQYEFHPYQGVFSGEWRGEEPEGITIWDLDNGRAPGISGQLHAIMLDNNINETDALYFKHYRIEKIGSATFGDPAIFTFIANRNSNSKEVHRSDCIWVGKMNDQNKVPYDSLQQALGDGYDGCFYCLKDHHRR